MKCFNRNLYFPSRMKLIEPPRLKFHLIKKGYFFKLHDNYQDENFLDDHYKSIPIKDEIFTGSK
jgi:hypothetical protein